jgi:hypothetical protein
MAADQNAREKLLRFLDQRAFDPILRASPDRYSGDDKDKLEHVKGATERTKQRYHHDYASAEEVRGRYLSWDKFLKYRIDPGYFQTDLSILVNLDRWNALSDEAQQILQDAAIEWEQESYELLQAQRAEEDAEMKKRGMQVVGLEPQAAEAYLNAAYEEAWSRLKERDPTHYDALRAKFFKDE